MSRKTPDHESAAGHVAPEFDDPRVRREWLLQEHAREQERAGAPMSGDDPKLAQYRLLSRALRAPVMEPIPLDFAAEVAQRAQAAASSGDRVERLLQQLLLGGLVLLGVGFAWTSSAAWLPPLQQLQLQQLLPQGTLSWGPVVAACCALTWGWDGVARMLGPGRARAA